MKQLVGDLLKSLRVPGKTENKVVNDAHDGDVDCDGWEVSGGGKFIPAPEEKHGYDYSYKEVGEYCKVTEKVDDGVEY